MNKGIALLAFTVAASSALAAPFTITFIGTGSGDNSVNLKVFGSNKNLFAGQLRFNTPTALNVPMFCADILTAISNPSYLVYPSLTSVNGDQGVVYAGRIFGKFHKDVMVGTTSTKNDKAAGMQLAIWEALYDQGAAFDGATGNLQVNSGATAGALAYAASYYAAIAESGWSATLLSPNPRNAGQAQLTAVPGPAALSMPVLWAVSALARRRRRAA